MSLNCWAILATFWALCSKRAENFLSLGKRENLDNLNNERPPLPVEERGKQPGGV